MRVAALKRLWERADPSPGQLLFRYAIYVRIASLEPAAWATCGSPEQRTNAVKQPNGRKIAPPATVIVHAWNAAFGTAFNGLVFKHRTGSKNPEEPNGHWTDELKIVS